MRIKGKLMNGAKDLTLEQEMKRRRAISKQRKGKHGYGRAAIDNINHFMSHKWRIVSPSGKRYEFLNLQSWCRKNESLFFPDERPESSTPLWRRAVGGFNNMQRTDRKGQTHWRGWTLESNEQP